MESSNLKTTLDEAEDRNRSEPENTDAGSVRSMRSAISARSMDSRSKFFRKRKRVSGKSAPSGEETPSGSEDEEEFAAPAAKERRSKRRPSTHGKYVGSHQAKLEKEAAERNEYLKVQIGQEDREIAEIARAVSNSRTPLRLSLAKAGEQEPDIEDLNAEELRNKVEASLRSIKTVSKISKGLKGTCAKTLKDAVQLMSEVTEELLSRTSNKEMQRLQKENANLKNQIAGLRNELEEMKAQLIDMKRANQTKSVSEREGQQKEPIEAVIVKLIREEMGKFTSRVEFLEGKILRPPLASESRQQQRTTGATFTEIAKAPKVPKGKSTAQATGTAPTPTGPSATAPLPSTQSKKKKGDKYTKAGRDVVNNAQNDSAALPPTTNTSEGGWQIVGAKKKAKNTKKKADKVKKRKLRAPRSAAVVITLQPEAEEKGLTYADVINNAKSQIALQDLGIPVGLRFRPTVTGARLLAVTGEANAEKADAFAAKLSEVLSPEEVRISRPTKCVGIRVTGLDDSVSAKELIAAVAKDGGCTEDQIKSTEVRVGANGLGTAIVSCPVTTAKKMVEGRRLLVGWVSAQVKLLKSRPMRCFRCQVEGHVGVRCTSCVNFKDLCYRCGQSGHKRVSCSADPHCPACEAEGKPAGHIAGGKECKQLKSNMTAPTRSGQPQVAIPAQRSAETETNMECH